MVAIVAGVGPANALCYVAAPPDCQAAWPPASQPARQPIDLVSLDQWPGKKKKTENRIKQNKSQRN